MNHKNLSIDKAVERICALNIPVLILDTCVLLDIVRVPLRAKTSKRANSVLHSSLRIRDMVISREQAAIIVIPPIVPKEWGDNIDKTVEEVKKHLYKLDSSLDVALTGCELVNIPVKQRLDALDKLGLEKKLEEVSRELLYSGLWLDEDNDIYLCGSKRATNRMAPGENGLVKDCIIYQHSLELLIRLRKNSFSRKCLFMTSNTEDFCLGPKFIPKEPIAEELKQVSTGFATRWDQAYWKLFGTNIEAARFLKK